MREAVRDNELSWITRFVYSCVMTLKLLSRRIVAASELSVNRGDRLDS